MRQFGTSGGCPDEEPPARHALRSGGECSQNEKIERRRTSAACGENYTKWTFGGVFMRGSAAASVTRSGNSSRIPPTVGM